MLEVKPSSIHGHGVFAQRDIPPQKYIGVIGGPIVNTETDHTINVEGIIIDPHPPFRFLNHSDDPNCEIVDGVWLRALKKIQQGQELTFHYGPDWA